MAKQGPRENDREHATEVEERCPVGMQPGRRCERHIHDAPPDVDETPVCLMHSHDPNKSETAFQKEFERTLQEAGEELADFTRFVFVSSFYARRELLAKCCFQYANFTQRADFTSATFNQDAEFIGVTFTQGVDFNGATFKRAADFISATFAQYVDFRAATFTQEASFVNSTFTQKAVFTGATFKRAAAFNGATFKRDAYFAGARFTQEADFQYTTFEKIVDLEACFEEAVEFQGTRFRNDPRSKNLEPGPIFTEAKFRKPEQVIFYKTHLEQALFHRCDVSKINFSDVFWRRRTNGKCMVFDEVIDPKPGPASNLRTAEGDPNARNYRLIAELYGQLKKNYDDRRDYWTAGDFHYGEMEMKRLATAPPEWISRRIGSIIGASRINALKRWLHQRLGLTALYKYASEYGESYVRPVLWLMLVLLIFTLLYPVAGLRYDVTRDRAAGTEPGRPTAQTAGILRLTYRDPLLGSGDKRPLWRARLALLSHSGMSALLVAVFRKDLTYEPRYLWGDLLEVAEQLLTSTLAALFLLAVRRQFKR